MTQPSITPRDDDRDFRRVTQDIAGRLRARGIAVYDEDSPDDIVQLLEAVESFERAVEAQGGDLMMDEPPSGGSAQPDDPRFLLPSRAADESAQAFLRRLNGATDAVVRPR